MYIRPVQKVVVFGPGPQFKGGISNFTVSLCKALEKQGNEVHLVSWTQQYPAIIPRDFIDRNSRTNLLEGSKITVHYITNYNNPFSWYKTANLIAKIAPQKVIFQWAIAIQGLPMGVIAQCVKRKLPHCEIIFDVHNVVQKETGELDKMLTRFALKKADTYIMHGQITIEEFGAFMPEVKFMVSTDGSRSKELKTILRLFHPIYDIFVPDPNFNVEQERKKEKLGTSVFLFFGFIRKYKGLHDTIEAFSRIAEKYPNASLIIAGESFWDTVDKKKWHVKLKKLLLNIKFH
jgi:glycosyltransferase involved in cell wall biosynthesis